MALTVVTTPKHKHHIIPKYEGGSDDSSNLVALSVTQHAMWHFAEWQRKGNKEDKIAWQALAKIIGNEEAIRQASGIGGSRSKGKKRNPEIGKRIGLKLKGRKRGKKGPRSQEVKEKIAATKRGRKWYVNEKGEASTFESNPGEGWTPGRKLPHCKKGPKTKCGVSKTHAKKNENGKSINAIKSGKTTSSQLWMCTVTGYVASPGPLSNYQKHRGIDTINRVNVE
jgi:hypothetical protein